MASPPSMQILAAGEPRKTSPETITAIFSEASQTQKQICIRLASTQFCFPLQPEQCAERDVHLDSLASTQGPAWRFWCVYNKDDPDQILASCRTLQRSLIVRESGGGIRGGKGFCISTVVTSQQYRKRGLATFLLTNVANWMDDEGEAEFSFLYTGLTKFYEPQGWHVQPSTHLLIQVDSVPKVDKEGMGLPSSAPLHHDDLSRSQCEAHVKSSVLNFGAHSVDDSGSSKTFVAIRPTYELTSFLYQRLSFMCGALHNGKLPDVSGSKCAHVRMFWCHDVKARQLIIHGLSYALPNYTDDDTVREVMSLLLDATMAARAWGLEQVAVWNPGPSVELAAQRLEGMIPGLKAKVEDRDWSVTMIRAKGANRSRQYVLDSNEYYAWN